MPNNMVDFLIRFAEGLATAAAWETAKWAWRERQKIIECYYVVVQLLEEVLSSVALHHYRPDDTSAIEELPEPIEIPHIGFVPMTGFVSGFSSMPELKTLSDYIDIKTLADSIKTDKLAFSAFMPDTAAAVHSFMADTSAAVDSFMPDTAAAVNSFLPKTDSAWSEIKANIIKTSTGFNSFTPHP